MGLLGVPGETPRPRTVSERTNAQWLAVGSVCIGAFMSMLDASIVTVAFRDMQRYFDEPLGTVQWVSLIYFVTVTVAATIAPIGRLSDAIGRKRVYPHGFALFTVGSAACAFALTLGVLIAFRVFQAAGAAMMASNSVAIVVTSVTPQTRRAALGVQTAAQALGLAAPHIGLLSI